MVDFEGVLLHLSQEFGFDRLAEHITHAFRDAHAFPPPGCG